MNILCGNCLDPDKRIKDGSVDLGIFDPPFGINETKFDDLYNRDSSNVLQGYKEAPQDYEKFTLNWMTEAKRVLSDHGSMYIIMGHTNLRHVLNAAANLGLYEINHLIWKYNFGVNTTRKFVTSHFHIMYYKKNKKVNNTFNLNCRFGSQEKNENGGSLVYRDIEDVFVINKEYSPNEIKNQNKLPEELIKKLILYSSNPGDMVCDFFMGNFTTAYCALKLGRHICGYEINKISYDYHIEKLSQIAFGCEIQKPVQNIVPENKGKKITLEEIENIRLDYKIMMEANMKVSEINQALQEKYFRGKFSITNIINKYIKKPS